ncbi:MAG: hypothetical protein KatS3mg087_1731 [Patescibacteria group bacterium]|nr:MAG: hypothetical protein KatS3mg087_1731 [Patescibacteria group bacterium]
MPPRKKQKKKSNEGTTDFRYPEITRINNPPVGLAPTYEARERQMTRYNYDPHLDPQLVWAGKAEHTSFEVDVVSLHIHERISTKAILRAVRRPEVVQPDLFGETPLPADQEVEFYRHEVGWANRLISGRLASGDELAAGQGGDGGEGADDLHGPALRHQVRLKQLPAPHRPARREGQGRGPHPRAGADQGLPGHLATGHPLLSHLPAGSPAPVPGTSHESGSIFVQINDENLHLVRCLLDEVFGRENFVAVVAFGRQAGRISCWT